MGIRFLDDEPTARAPGSGIRFLDDDVPAVAPAVAEAAVRPSAAGDAVMESGLDAHGIYAPGSVAFRPGEAGKPEQRSLFEPSAYHDSDLADRVTRARAGEDVELSRWEQQLVEPGRGMQALGAVAGSSFGRWKGGVVERLAEATGSKGGREISDMLGMMREAERSGLLAPDSFAGEIFLKAAPAVATDMGLYLNMAATKVHPSLGFAAIESLGQMGDVLAGERDKADGAALVKAAVFGEIFRAFPFKGWLGGSSGGAGSRVAGRAAGVGVRAGAATSVGMMVDLLDPDSSLRREVALVEDPAERAKVFGERFAQQYARTLPIMLAYSLPGMIKAGQTGNLETRLRDYGLQATDAQRMANAAAQGKSISGMARGLRMRDAEIRDVANQFRRQYYGSHSLGDGSGAAAGPDGSAAPALAPVAPVPAGTVPQAPAPAPVGPPPDAVAVPAEPPVAAPADSSVAGYPRIDVSPSGEPLIDERAIPIYRVPVEMLQLSEDVPNFKEDADSRSGVVRGQELQGEYTEQGTGTLVAWERQDGRLEVITGRHRLDLAKRSGKQTLPVQVLREADGFDAVQAMRLDSEMNIRDGQGKVKDYANYFRNSEISLQEASGGGLLARDKGRKGWILGKLAGDNLYTGYRNGVIAEAKAAAIAEVAPNNDDLQRVGLQHALDNKSLSADDLRHYLNAVQSLVGASAGGDQLDMFGSNDAAMNDAKKLAASARAIQNRLTNERRILSASDKIGKATGENAAVLEKYGVQAGDADAISARIQELMAEIDSWDSWPMDAAKVAMVRQEAGLEMPAESPGAGLDAPKGEAEGIRFVDEPEPGGVAGDVVPANQAVLDEMQADMDALFGGDEAGGPEMRYSLREPAGADLFSDGGSETPLERELRLVAESRRDARSAPSNVDVIASRALQSKAAQLLEAVRSGAMGEDAAAEAWRKSQGSIARVSKRMKSKATGPAPVEQDLFAAPAQGPAPGMLFDVYEDGLDGFRLPWQKLDYERRESYAIERFKEHEEGWNPQYAGETIVYDEQFPGVRADQERFEVLRARRDFGQAAVREEAERLAVDPGATDGERKAWAGVSYSYWLAESMGFEDLLEMADSAGIQLVPVRSPFFDGAQVGNKIFISDVEAGEEILLHEMFHVADEAGSDAALALRNAVDRDSVVFKRFHRALRKMYREYGQKPPTAEVAEKELAARLFAAGGEMQILLLQDGAPSVEIGDAFKDPRHAGNAVDRAVLSVMDDLSTSRVLHQSKLMLSVPADPILKAEMQALYDQAQKETDPQRLDALKQEWAKLRDGARKGSKVAGMAAPGIVDAPGYAQDAPALRPVPADDPEFTQFPVELPEFVRMARILHPKGAAPKVIGGLRGNYAGVFRYRPGEDAVGIELRADNFKLVPTHEKEMLWDAALAEVQAQMPERSMSDPEARDAIAVIYQEKLDEATEAAMHRNPAYASKVAWHELGHWIDFVPQKMVQGRGNILGRLKSAHSYFTNMIQDTPQNPNELLSPKDRQKLRRQAERSVGPRPPKDEEADRLAWSEEVSRVYAELVAGEAENRGLITRADVQEELEGLLRWFNGSDNIAYYQAKSSEMYADTFSALMNNPAAVRARAPLFWKLWHNWLNEKPQAAALLKRIQEDIRLARIPEQREKAQMESQLRADETADAIERELSRKAPGEVMDLVLQAVDRRYHPIYRRAGAVEKKGVASGRQAHDAVSDWLYHANTEAAFMHRVEQQSVQPLRDAGVPIEEFNAFLENQHIIHNRADIASMGGMNPHASQQALDAQRERLGDAAYDAMTQAAERRWEIREKYILGELEKSGVLSPALMDHLKLSKWYSTVAAVDTGQDPVDALFKRSFGNDMSSRIHKAVGYLGDAKSPLLATMRKDLSLLRLARSTSLKIDVGEMLRDFEDPMFRQADMRWDASRRMPMPVIVENDRVGTIVYVQGGKPRGYYAPRAVVDAMNYETPAAMNTFVHMARHGISNIKALYTSLNYGFWPFNYLRDVKGAVRKLPDMYSRAFGKNAWIRYRKPAHAAAKSLAAGKPDALALQALDRGVIMMRRDRLDDVQGYDSFQKFMLSMNVNPEMYGIKADGSDWMRKLWRKYQSVGQTLEWETKIVGMLHLDKTQPEVPMADRSNMVRHISGSANYLEKGTMNWAIDWLFPFYNPAKQYARSEFKAWQQNPWQTLFKSLKYAVVPKMLKAALVGGGLGAYFFGQKWEDERVAMDASIPDYDKDRYDTWPIMWADKAQGKVLYYRSIEDEFERIYGGFFQQFLDQRFDWRNAFDYAGGQVPGLNPLISVGMAWNDYLAGSQPRDRFGPIVDQGRMDEGAGWSEMAKYTANQLGAGIVVRFSPNDWHNPHETRIEKVLRSPVISNTLGRFFRVSNAGLAQQARRDLAPHRAEMAGMRREVRTIVLRELSGADMTAEQRQYLMSTPGAGAYYRTARRRLEMEAKTDPYQRAVLRARGNPQRLNHLDTSTLDSLNP